MNSVETRWIDDLPAPNRASSHVVTAGGFAVVAGAIGVAGDGLLADSAEEQLELALAHVAASLEAVGTCTSDLVDMTIYLGAEISRKTVNEQLLAWLGIHRPAVTILRVGLMRPGQLVEVKAMAKVKGIPGGQAAA